MNKKSTDLSLKNQNVVHTTSLKKEYTVEELLNLAKELIQENEKLKTQISELRSQLNVRKKLPVGYNTKWSWIAKIVFVLRNENKPLRATEMIELFSSYEEVFDLRENKVTLLSAYLVKAQQYGKIIPMNSKGIRGAYYYLPEWNDNNGQLQAEMKKKML